MKYSIHGLLIGDAHISKNGRISIKHSILQKDWALYKQQCLLDLGFKISIYYQSPRDFHCNGKIIRNKESITIETSSTTYSKQLRKLYYPNGIKIVPDNIFLTEVDWAFIYMDDGNQNKISHYNTIIKGNRVRIECDPFVNKYRIHTEGFDIISQNKLRQSLLDLGVYSTYENKPESNRKYLVISRSLDKCAFYNMIQPYILPSMQYKISALPSLLQTKQRERLERVDILKDEATVQN